MGVEKSIIIEDEKSIIMVLALSMRQLKARVIK